METMRAVSSPFVATDAEIRTIQSHYHLETIAEIRARRQALERAAIIAHLAAHPLPCKDYRTCGHITCETRRREIDTLRQREASTHASSGT